MNDFGVMQYAAAGMEAQRSALDVLAQNLALVQTADPKHPVHTLVPQFTSTPEGDEFAASLAAADKARAQFKQMKTALVAAEAELGQLAAAVIATNEKLGVLGAQRAFEASAAVFDTGKRLIEKTLSVEQGT